MTKTELAIFDEARFNQLNSLKRGKHNPDGEYCFMEAVSVVVGRDWSDHDESVCHVIGEFLRSWNDHLPSDEDRDRLLKPLIPAVINTRSTPKVERRRAWLVTDWLIRSFTPEWLACVPRLVPHAKALRESPAILNAKLARKYQGTKGAAQNAAQDAAWDAAEYAAGYATGYAAWAAAWYAARNAAWATAWAAARYAAGAEAAAGDKLLQPTVDTLQQSALDLVHRMIAVTETP